MSDTADLQQRIVRIKAGLSSARGIKMNPAPADIDFARLVKELENLVDVVGEIVARS
jgi:hypothetical protein